MTSDEIMPEEIWVQSNEQTQGTSGHWNLVEAPRYRRNVKTKYTRTDRHTAALKALEVAKASLMLSMKSMVPAFDRLHCLPRSTDTVMAENIDYALQKAREALATIAAIEEGK